MEDQHKLQRLLEMLLYLSSGIKYSREEIAKRFDMAERSVYRYIKTFREAGFIIPQPLDGLYYIDKQSPYFKEIDELLHFSKEEAYILQKAIHSISNENLLKQKLVNKLYSLYNTEGVAETIFKAEYSNTIHQLKNAIEKKQRVILCDYASANSNNKQDRLVEPFEFTSNFIAVWAYDVENKCCKQFKNTRIDSVKILSDTWEYEQEHIPVQTDVFRISSEENIPIKLKLSLRATELLKEEYPLSEKHIRMVEDNEYYFEASVCGFEGVGRFVMGLSHEMEVIYPTELKDFIKKRAEKILSDGSWQ